MTATRRFVWLKLPSACRRVCWLGLAGLAAVAILAACSDPSTPLTASEPSDAPTPTVMQPPDAAASALIAPGIPPTDIPSPAPVDPGGCSHGIAVPNPENNPGLVKDCEILIRSLHVLMDDSPHPLSWTTHKNIHWWRGITVDGTPPRVTGVEIFFRRLVDTADDLITLNGSLPSELGNLTGLRRLDLRSNQLTGEIPASLGELSNLEVLNLRSNQLTGEIPPALGKLKNLRELWLGYNQLTGEIPDSLGDLTSLEKLELRSNKLTGGILASLGNLTIWKNCFSGVTS